MVGPPPQSAEGGLERGGVCPRIEGPRRSTLERVRDCLRFEGPLRRTLERGGGGSTASEASEGPLRGAGTWAERDLGFPYLKKLRASEFRKDLARVPNYVLRVLGGVLAQD